MAPPVCWIDKAFDRSPAELVRVDSPSWGALHGAVLNLSYGQGRIEVLVSERVDGVEQGAVCALPIPDFPTGIMRGRFHPQRGDLFLCGLSAWATSQMLQEGGLYRLRATGQPMHLPVGWHVTRGGLELTFTDPLASNGAEAFARHRVRVWSLKRTASYGSPRIDERDLVVTAATLLPDRRTLRLSIPDLAPTDVVEITCQLAGSDGNDVKRVITGTIHRVP
jgi:hypothetical protein